MATKRPDALPSRTEVDIATGIVIGIQGGTPTEALDHILCTAKANQLNLFQVSRALIAYADGSRGNTRALLAVASEWGPLLCPDSHNGSAETA